MIDYLKRFVSNRIERVSSEENFFISAGMEFYGDLVARSSSGRMDGHFEGRIIECRKIIIGPDAVIKGNIFADHILLYGYCEGNMFATVDVKVFNSAVIVGDIHTCSLLVEREASFRGNVKTLKTEEMSAFAMSEKERIILRSQSEVHNIYSLQAKAKQESHRVRKVANSSVDSDYPAASGMKKWKKL
ncbi:MAG: polymer-forming cytoskeletal protein [Bacteroidetes bacterium]|nr:polymer-forming cytoskeletal protein [Bacteroidota bacterium]